MTLDFAELDRLPGYAGPLQASQPALARRFHFWRGLSGRRYACSRFPANRAPGYADAVSLFVRREDGQAIVLGVSAQSDARVIPLGTEEIHLHIVPDGPEALHAALQDLGALAVPSGRMRPATYG